WRAHDQHRDARLVVEMLGERADESRRPGITEQVPQQQCQREGSGTQPTGCCILHDGHQRPYWDVDGRDGEYTEDDEHGQRVGEECDDVEWYPYAKAHGNTDEPPARVARVQAVGEQATQRSTAQPADDRDHSNNGEAMRGVEMEWPGAFQ